jgi:hypothetical protein
LPARGLSAPPHSLLSSFSLFARCVCLLAAAGGCCCCCCLLNSGGVCPLARLIRCMPVCVCVCVLMILLLLMMTCVCGVLI